MPEEARLILSATKNVQSVSKFIYGDQLPTVLRSIAGQDSIDSALLALNMKSKSPEMRIHSAINHLESAHTSYSKIYKSVTNYYIYRAREKEFEASIKKNFLVCSLMALCYYGLKDYSAVKQVCTS